MGGMVHVGRTAFVVGPAGLVRVRVCSAWLAGLILAGELGGGPAAAAPAEPMRRAAGAPAAALATGDAVRAMFAGGVNALFFNPAGLALGREFMTECGYGYDSDADAHNFHAALVEGFHFEGVGWGVAYSHIRAGGGGGNDFHGGLAAGFGGRDLSFSLGFAARLLDPAPSGRTVLTFHAGVLLASRVGRNTMIAFGLSGRNLIDIAPNESREVGGGLGMSFFRGRFAVETDLVV